MKLIPLGDSALLLDFTDEPLSAEQLLLRVRSAADVIERAGIPGIVEVTSSYGTVALFLDLPRLASEAMPMTIASFLEQRVKLALHSSVQSSRTVEDRLVEIPVCYAPDFAPDLARVGQHTGLDIAEVIQLHTAPQYITACVGFLPGFPYLLGLPEQLHVPRLSTPRTSVPAGSVAIAGGQAGVYPFESPAGWNVIGRTPLRLFDPDADPPALLRTGDRVRFRAITRAEFNRFPGSLEIEPCPNAESSPRAQ